MAFEFLNPARLMSRMWGRKIEDKNGERRDTGVQPAIEEVYAVMSQQRTIDLRDGPVTINNYTNGPAITINNLGSENQTAGVNVTNEAGETVQLGLGIGNVNIVANEYIPLQTATLNSAFLQYYFYQGNQITYQQATQIGLPVPPSGPGRMPGQVYNGTQYQTGQPYPPGSMVGGSGQSGMIGGQQGTTGYPFTLYPPFSGNQAIIPTKPKPGGNMTTGYSGDITVVTDVTWDEATCVMTKTTMTITVEDGLVKGVA